MYGVFFKSLVIRVSDCAVDVVVYATKHRINTGPRHNKTRASDDRCFSPSNSSARGLLRPCCGYLSYRQ